MDFDFSNLNEEQLVFIERLEHMGESAVAASVNSNIWGAKRTLAFGWLEFKKKEREIQAWQASVEAARASETTAKVAEDSMREAAKSAYWTKWSAFATAGAAMFTAVAAIATGAQVYLQYERIDTKASDGIVQPQVQGRSISDHHGAPPGRVDLGTTRAR